MVYAFYPKADGTGYQDIQRIQSGKSTGGTFADLDGDGDRDYVCANRDEDAQIFWGNGSGTWSDVGATNLSVSEGFCFAHTGDFNGDDEEDVLIRASAGTNTSVLIFLNNGGGRFDYTADIEITTLSCNVGDPPGDLNNDGYDDILLVRKDDGGADLYYGGALGPDTTLDINYPNKGIGRACIDDINNDGYLDIVLSANVNGKSFIFLGSKNGPDTTPDYRLTVPDAGRIDVGDLNADGYYDLVFSIISGDDSLRVFKGSENGWTDSRKYDISTSEVLAHAIIDINKDGYDDIACVGRSTTFRVFFGGLTWPTVPGISKPAECYSFQMTIAAPKRIEINATLPSSPLNLTAVGGDGFVRLDWEPPVDTGGKNLLSYMILRGPTENNLTIKTKVNRALRTYLDNDCTNGETYYYAITAVNFKGMSNRSNIVNATPLGPPGAPGNLLATPGCGTIALDWQEPSLDGGVPVLGYHLFRGFGISQIAFYTNVGNRTHFDDVGLENGQGCYYKVRAYNPVGNGTLSEATYAIPVGPPEGLSFIKATGEDGRVNLQWGPPTSDGGNAVLGYRIQKGTAEDSLAPFHTVDGAARDHIDTAVVNGLSYYYAISAFNEIGDGPLSEIVEATPRGPPGAPSNLLVVEGDSSVELSWDPPSVEGGSPIEHYYIYLASDEDPLTWWCTVEGTSSVIDELINGRTYTLGISAVNGIGEGDMSETVTGTPFALPGIPRDVAAEGGILKIVLTWNAPLDTGGFDVEGYTIYRGDIEERLEFLADIVITSMTYTDWEVDGGTSYYYAVSAVSSKGEGAASATVSAVPIEPPGPPGDLTATAGDGEVSLIWSPPTYDGGSPVTGYAILRGDSPESPALLVQVGLETTFIDASVTNDNTYFYTVATVNIAGQGERSGEVEVTPFRPAHVPGKVSALAAEAKGNDVSVTWSAPSDDGGSPITGYIVLRGPSLDDLREIATVGVLASFDDEDLERGRTYYYSVAAINDVGQGEPVPAFEVKVQKKKEEGPGLEASLALTLLMAVALLDILRRHFPRER